MTLPVGWTSAPLGDVTEQRVDQGEPGKSSVNYIDIGSIDRDQKRVGVTDKVNSATAPTRARQWVRSGDVLVSMTRPNLNAVAMVTPDLDGAVASTGFDVLRTIGILPEWVFYRVRSQAFVQDVCQDVQGVVYPAIRPDDVRRHIVPIPPFDEQRRIVDAVESYLSRLDAVATSLERTQAKLKAYRASVLKAAVEGRLVPTEAQLARVEKRDYETADVLLKRILAERRRRWEDAELAKLQVAGRGPDDGKLKRKYKEPVTPDTSELPKLPDGWCWATVGQATWPVKDGPHYSPPYAEAGIPFVTGGHVRPWGIDFDRAKRISADVHRELCERVSPETGDILYTKGGTTGIARVNTYAQPFSVWVHVAVLKLAPSMNPFYLQHALNSPWCYAQAQRFTHGVGNQDLGLTRMVKIVFPLPPRDEQDRIVDEVDRLESVARENTDVVEAQARRVRRLCQGILKWAFEGKLVDQNPNDEPAGKLLERIIAQRAVKALVKKTRGRKAKAAS